LPRLTRIGPPNGGNPRANRRQLLLKDKSPAAKEKLVAACQKYLKGHDGVAYFSAGVIADDFARDVNDRDWDVAVHLVFNDKVAHDNYQTAERHKQFVKENNTNWAKVRVFDSAIAAEKK